MKLIVPDCRCLANTAIERQVIPRSVPLEKKAALWLLVTIQGVYAEVNQHPTHFIVRAALNGGIRDLQLKNITPVTLED